MRRARFAWMAEGMRSGCARLERWGEWVRASWERLEQRRLVAMMGLAHAGTKEEDWRRMGRWRSILTAVLCVRVHVRNVAVG